jgi:hypothetical protein
MILDLFYFVISNIYQYKNILKMYPKNILRVSRAALFNKNIGKIKNFFLLAILANEILLFIIFY